MSCSLGSQDSDEVLEGIPEKNFFESGYPSDWGSDEEELAQDAADPSQARNRVLNFIDLCSEESSGDDVSEVPPTLPVPSTPVARPPPFMDPPAPGRPFRINAKKLFLTYPQCDTGPVTALENIQRKFGAQLVSCVVAQELHEDGNLHLHVALELSKPVDTRDVHFFDFVTGTHGNYQGARDWSKVLAYCVKYGHYIAHGIDPKAYLQAREKKKSTSFAHVAGRMMEGASIAELTTEVPGFVLQHLPKMKQFSSHLVSVQSLKANLLPLPPMPSLEECPSLLQDIYQWILRNIRVPRAFGDPNLAITGPTGIGKTTFLLALSKFCRIYWVPMEENFFDSYDDTAYDVLVFDEYKSQKTIQFMNSFVQGAPLTLRTKGGQTMKKKNLPVILLSNYTPQEMYPNVWAEQPAVLDSFIRRFSWFALSVDTPMFPLASYLDPQQFPK